MSRRPDRSLDSASPTLSRRSAPRRVAMRSDLPLDLPVNAQEIQMIAEAMGAAVAALFEEDS